MKNSNTSKTLIRKEKLLKSNLSFQKQGVMNLEAALGRQPRGSMMRRIRTSSIKRSSSMRTSLSQSRYSWSPICSQRRLKSMTTRPMLIRCKRNNYQNRNSLLAIWLIIRLNTKEKEQQEKISLKSSTWWMRCLRCNLKSTRRKLETLSKRSSSSFKRVEMWGSNLVKLLMRLMI